MRKTKLVLGMIVLATLPLWNAMMTAHAQTPQPAWMKDSIAKVEEDLIAKYGEAQRPRLQRGLQQVASFWRTEDGDAAEFEAFVSRHFAGEAAEGQAATLDTMFARFEHCWNKSMAT